MLSENGDVIKIGTTGRQTTRPWVSEMADRRYHDCGFSLDRNDFQSFHALARAFNPAEGPLRFHKKGRRYFKASDLASFGKNEDKTTLSKPAKTSKVLDKTWTNFSMVGQLCR